MAYEIFPASRFFKEIDTEEKAREFCWRIKFNGKDFQCSYCGEVRYSLIRSRPEIRHCVGCRRHIRLRAGTIFEHSKKNILLWLKAIYFITQGKRGISAMELQRHLGLRSYQTAWAMLHKIRESLRQRDLLYKLGGTIEVDGALFGHWKNRNHMEMIIAVETKKGMDKQGKIRLRAGFARALAGGENMTNTTRLSKNIEPGTIARTDGHSALKHMPNVVNDYRKIPSRGREKVLNERLGMVHKMISNTRRWLLGTHHGVSKKYLDNYLSEYFYRFNRRHDQDGLFHRALLACILAKPKTYVALFG